MVHEQDCSKRGKKLLSMKNYIVNLGTVLFRQSSLPTRWMEAMSILDVYVTLTGSKRYPYSVQLSESEFLSIIELAKEL